MSRYRVVFYNVGPVGENGRGPQVLERELNAIRRTGAKIITGCEFVGWGDLPELPNMHKIRSRKTEGRANIAAWVHDDLHFDPDNVRWHAHTEKWNRTERRGVHWPRETLEFVADGAQWFVAHQCPRFTNNTKAAQQEGIELLHRRMAPWKQDGWSRRSEEAQKASKGRLRVVLWDPNRSPNAPVRDPGPNQLARRVEGWKVGTAIEGGVIRGGQFLNPRKQTHAGAMRLGSDHNGAFFATVVSRD